MRSSMLLSVCAVTVSMLVAVAWGTVVGAAVVILSGMPIQLDLDLLADAIEFGVLSSAMCAIPLGLVGGIVVARMLWRGPRGWDRRQWSARGARHVALIGGIVPFGVLVFIEPLGALLYGAICAFTGSLCGATMGCWCARVERRRRAAPER
jgi:hypothetical protein